MASAHTPATLASAAIVPGWFFQTKKKGRPEGLPLLGEGKNFQPSV
jgi:hypothetical protein